MLSGWELFYTIFIVYCVVLYVCRNDGLDESEPNRIVYPSKSEVD